MKELLEGIQLGADPEFAYRDAAGEPTSAHLYQDYSGPFGTDGCSCTCEIRPGISNNAIELVSKIHHIMRLAYTYNPRVAELKWLAGSFVDNKTLGGHIHISHSILYSKVFEDPPKPFRVPYPPDRNDQARKWLTPVFEALDTLLYYGLSIPLEDSKQRTYRKNRGYGGPNRIRFSWRAKSPTQTTLSPNERVIAEIEYRSCGSWIISPEVALAYLGIAKIAAVWGLARRLKEVPRGSVKKYEKLALAIRQKGLTATIKATIDLLDFLDSIMALPLDCKAAIYSYKLISSIGIDWEADLRGTWALDK